jgi:hypothetical protein
MLTQAVLSMVPMAIGRNGQSWEGGSCRWTSASDETVLFIGSTRGSDLQCKPTGFTGRYLSPSGSELSYRSNLDQDVFGHTLNGWVTGLVAKRWE